MTVVDLATGEPSVLRTIIPIVGVGIVATAVATYALAANPPIALGAFAIGLLFLAYVVERSFRYAENNPLPALLGGGEL
jgi:membrane protein implicated in regulation of membrane protease activity